MVKYDVPKVVNQMRHVEGAPFGTRGGTAVVHNFPADGEYTFKLELYYYYLGELIGGNLPESLQGQELEISVDGERVAALHDRPAAGSKQGRWLTTPPIKIKAGPRRFAAAFVAKADGAVEDQCAGRTDLDGCERRLAPGHDHIAASADADGDGAVEGAGVSDTPSRKKIFTCRPADRPRKSAAPRRSSTRSSPARFAGPRRRRISKRLIDMYKLGREEGSFRGRHPHGYTGDHREARVRLPL